MKLAIMTSRTGFVNSFKKNKSIHIDDKFIFDLTDKGLTALKSTAIPCNKLAIIYDSNEIVNELSLLRTVQYITTPSTSALAVEEIVMLVKDDGVINKRQIDDLIKLIIQKSETPIRLEYYLEDSHSTYIKLIIGETSIESVPPRVYNKFIGKANSTSSTIQRDDLTGSITSEDTEIKEINQEFKKNNKALVPSMKGKKFKHKKKKENVSTYDRRVRKKPTVHFKNKSGVSNIILFTGLKYSGKTFSIVEMFNKLQQDGDDVLILNLTNRPNDYTDVNNTSKRLELIQSYDFFIDPTIAPVGNLISINKELFDYHLVADMSRALPKYTLLVELDLKDLHSIIKTLDNIKYNLYVTTGVSNIELRDTMEILGDLGEVNLVTSTVLENNTKFKLFSLFQNILKVNTMDEILYKDVNSEEDEEILDTEGGELY